MPGLSKSALERCRKMVITHLQNGRYELKVTDPRLGERSVISQVVRTEHDLYRYKLNFMKRYRIPQENITVIEQDTDEESNGTDNESPEVHEHRSEVLGDDKEQSHSKPKKPGRKLYRKA